MGEILGTGSTCTCRRRKLIADGVRYFTLLRVENKDDQLLR